MRNAKSLSRQERRELMPETSSFVDAFTAEFGPVHVLYANENGCEWNSPDMTKVRYAVRGDELECWYEARRLGSSVGDSLRRPGVRNRKVAR